MKYGDFMGQQLIVVSMVRVEVEKEIVMVFKYLELSLVWEIELINR